MKIIIITSPATDAGKTFIASGLAEAATTKGLKTLFIDFDSPVGDATRVFGTATNELYPTVTSWPTFEKPWEYCLKSTRGTYILPKPDLPQDIINKKIISDLLDKARESFDLIICDLGNDFRADYWSFLVQKANLALLVSDCDEKALVRIQEFLGKAMGVPKNKWVLTINSREQKGLYTSRQMVRILGEDESIGSVIEVPHFKNIQKGTPKTFSPDEKFASALLDMVLVTDELDGEILCEEYAEVKAKAEEEPGPEFETEPESELKPEERTSFQEDYEPTDLAANFLLDDDIGQVPYEPEIDKPEDVRAGLLVISSDNANMLEKEPISEKEISSSFLYEQEEENAPEMTEPPDVDTNKMLINLSQRLTELETSVEIDGLTGLFNRKYFETWINKQIAEGNHFSLAIIDIDNFKHINDTYGHLNGDVVLTYLGFFLRSRLRVTDISVRYGGEEFIIGFPDMNIQETYNTVERLRAEWSNEKIPISENREISCTFSAGLSACQKGWNRDQIVGLADKYLYEAKNSGRNKTCGLSDEDSNSNQIEIESAEPQNTDIIDNQMEIENKLTIIKSYAELTNAGYKIIAIWNPDGYCKAQTALELARHYKKDVALIEFDLVNPELDYMMEIPLPPLHKSMNKNYWEIGAGLLTFEDMNPELVSRLLYKYKWGIEYLPAGNRLGMTDIKHMSQDSYEALITIISKGRRLIINAPNDLKNTTTVAAFRKSDVVIVPMKKDNTYSQTQAEWLFRAGFNVIKYFPEKKERRTIFKIPRML